MRTLGYYGFTKPSNNYGSAHFAKLTDLKRVGMLKSGGLILGRQKGKAIFAPASGHLFCVAPTGAGKTTSLVIPNVMRPDNKNSMLIIDPKGEVRDFSWRQRYQLGRVFVWEPFADLTHSYNPLDFIRIGTADERDDADLLVGLLVPYGKNEEPFWIDEARQLVLGLILFILHEFPAPRRTLAELRHLLMLGIEDLRTLMTERMQVVHHPLIQSCASAFAQKDIRQFSGVLATAQSRTRIWESPRLAAVSRKSSFQFSQLKKQTTTIYLVVPPEQLETYYPALRVIVGLAIAEVSRSAKTPKAPLVTFVLDEFANLGRLQPAETAVSIARHAGVQLCLFVQDLAQLKRVYGDAWRSFSANCQTKVFFGINDIDEAKRLSETLGSYTVRSKHRGSSRVFMGTFLPDRISSGTGETKRALLTPDELLNLHQDEIIILQQGLRPIRANRTPPWRDGKQAKAS